MKTLPLVDAVVPNDQLYPQNEFFARRVGSEVDTSIQVGQNRVSLHVQCCFPCLDVQNIIRSTAINFTYCSLPDCCLRPLLLPSTSTSFPSSLFCSNR